MIKEFVPYEEAELACLIKLIEIVNQNQNKDELENMEMVHYRMDAEGFHYCFKHYSDFNEINDEKFHDLRLKYFINNLNKNKNERI